MATDKPRTELMEALSSLYKDGKYSDLTIICGESTYKVHKAILCPRSQFLEKLEATTGIIDLSDDDPQAVLMMIRYFYHLDYPHVALHQPHEVTSVEGFDDDDQSDWSARNRYCRTGSSNPDIPTHLQAPNLIIHSNVYALGEQYNIDGMKAIALEKFVEEVKVHWATEDFLQAAQHVYTCTPEHDRGLKDEVKKVFTDHRKELMDKEKVKRCLRDVPDLAYDVLMHMHMGMMHMNMGNGYNRCYGY